MSASATSTVLKAIQSNIDGLKKIYTCDTSAFFEFETVEKTLKAAAAIREVTNQTHELLSLHGSEIPSSVLARYPVLLDTLRDDRIPDGADWDCLLGFTIKPSYGDGVTKIRTARELITRVGKAMANSSEADSMKETPIVQIDSSKLKYRNS